MNKLLEIIEFILGYTIFLSLIFLVPYYLYKVAKTISNDYTDNIIILFKDYENALEFVLHIIITLFLVLYFYLIIDHTVYSIVIWFISLINFPVLLKYVKNTDWLRYIISINVYIIIVFTVINIYKSDNIRDFIGSNFIDNYIVNYDTVLEKTGDPVDKTSHYKYVSYSEVNTGNYFLDLIFDSLNFFVLNAAILSTIFIYYLKISSRFYLNRLKMKIQE